MNSFELRDEFNKFKSEIDLVEFMHQKAHNFKYVASKSSTSTFCFEDGASKLFVYKKSGEWKFKDYKPPIGVKGSGSVIDIMQDYLKVPFKDIRKELRSYMNLTPVELPVYNSITKKIKDEKDKIIPKHHFSTSKLRYTKYLNDRGIENNTIFSETFNNRVRQKDIEKDGKTRFTTVFPMFKKLGDDVVGLEQSNNVFKGSYSGSNKADSFWKSNPPKAGKPSIFVGENPIDAMAHYQLHNPNNKDNLIYISSFGEFSENKIDILNNYITAREHKIDKLILGMDNDVAGSKFNINIIGNVHLKDTDKDFTAYISTSQHTARLTVSSSDINKIEAFEKEISHIANNQLELTSNHDLQYRDYQFSKDENGKHTFSFLMNNRKKVIQPLEKVVKDFKNSKFEIVRSNLKDFGEDLEKLKGIEKTYKVIGKYADGKDKLMRVWNKPNPIKNLDNALDLSK